MSSLLGNFDNSNEWLFAQNNVIIARIALAQLLQITDYVNFDIAEEDFWLPNSRILDQSPKDIFEKAKDDYVTIADLEIRDYILPKIKEDFKVQNDITFNDDLYIEIKDKNEDLKFFL